MTETSSERSAADKAYLRYQEKRKAFWDANADVSETDAAGYYHDRLAQIYRFLIPAGSSVIELGSGDGDLLAALEPKRGLGVDFSSRNIHLARSRHQELEFIEADVHEPRGLGDIGRPPRREELPLSAKRPRAQAQRRSSPSSSGVSAAAKRSGSPSRAR